MFPNLMASLRPLVWVSFLVASIGCDEQPKSTVDTARAVEPMTTSARESADRDSWVARPNVVLIVGDDVGVDLVGSYAKYHPPTAGRYAPETPVLDALAAEGVSFRNVWTNPGCSTSRAQILSGRHSRRTGIGALVTWLPNRNHLVKNFGLSHDLTLLPQILKQGPVPYETAAVGKWHLGSPQQGGLHALGPDGAWFDHWAGSSFNLNGVGLGYRRWTKTFASRITEDDECGSSYPCTAMLDESASCRDYATVDTIDDALGLLETLREPFFLYVAFNAPHSPLDLPQCSLPPTCTEGELAYPTQAVDLPQKTRAMTRTMDHQIGRLLCSIDSEDTVVMFIGDNGTAGDDSSGQARGIVAPFPGDHGKATLYNGGVNVPLIVRGPGIAPGVDDALVNSTDLFATIAELAGVPDTSAIPRDSISLVPYLYGSPHPTPRATIHAEFFVPTFIPADFDSGTLPSTYKSQYHRRAVRNQRFKLIERHRGGRFVDEEYYDLGRGGPTESGGQWQRDDFEQNDLMLVRDDWEVGGVVEEAYWSLKQDLTKTLPALP